MASTVTVNIVGDADSLKRALGEAEGSLSKFGQSAQRVGERATSIGRSLTIGVTLPLAGLGKLAFDELQSAAAASAQTAAAIKSTGGAANVTAAQVEALATSLLKKTGIDDEAIKSGENLLLTFRNIRNETGKGNDIFNQATKAVVDLSVAFGKDMQSSAVLVGKALNDPLKGLTALTRVGVTFTEQQKEQIKALVETGDVMGAQKVILKELSDEVGGSGKAFGDSFAGQISKAKEELNNAGAAILASVLPAIKSLASTVVGAAEGFSRLPEPVKQVGVALAAIAAAAGPLTYVFGAVAKGVSGVVSIVGFASKAYETLALKVLYAVDALQAMGAAQLLATGAIAAGVIAVGALIVYLGQTDGLYERISSAAEEWGRKTILAAKSSGDEFRSLQTTSKALEANIDDLRAAQKFYSDAISEGQPGAQGYRDRLDEISKQLLIAQKRHEAIAPELARVRGEVEAQQAALAAQKAAVHDVATGTTDWANATEDAKSALLDLQSAVLAASGGVLGLEQANLNLTKAQQDYTTALEEGDPQKIAEAELNLKEARLGVASATLQAQDSQQKLLDVVKQGPDAVEAEIKKLKDAQTTYGDTSGAIQEQIDVLVFLNGVLNGLPKRTAPQVVLDGLGQFATDINGAHTALDGLNNRRATVYVDVVKQTVETISPFN